MSAEELEKWADEFYGEPGDGRPVYLFHEPAQEHYRIAYVTPHDDMYVGVVYDHHFNDTCAVSRESVRLVTVEKPPESQ